MCARLLLLGIASLTIGFGHWTAAEPTPKSASAAEPLFSKELLQAAAEYKNWGRVDDEMRWSPELCRIPNPGRAQVSASKDETTHGKKLYSLLTNKRDAYWKLAATKSVPIGFAIVKQSWLPEEITDPRLIPKSIDRSKVISTPGTKSPLKNDIFATLGDHFYPYTFKDGKCFTASKQADLFIMLKLDPKTLGTDDGWVYGTVSPDGKSVTASGKLESCMKCHQEAKTDRLFGLAR